MRVLVREVLALVVVPRGLRGYGCDATGIVIGWPPSRQNIKIFVTQPLCASSQNNPPFCHCSRALRNVVYAFTVFKTDRFTERLNLPGAPSIPHWFCLGGDSACCATRAGCCDKLCRAEVKTDVSQ